MSVGNHLSNSRLGIDPTKYEENKMVIFKNVQKLYDEGKTVKCTIQIPDGVLVSADDYVGIISIHSNNLNDCATTLRVPNDGKNEKDILFQAQSLPQNFDDFCQFVYVSEGDIINGISIPFIMKTLPTPLTSLEKYFLIHRAESESLLGHVPASDYQKLNKFVRMIKAENDSLTAELADCDKKLQEDKNAIISEFLKENKKKIDFFNDMTQILQEEVKKSQVKLAEKKKLLLTTVQDKEKADQCNATFEKRVEDLKGKIECLRTLQDSVSDIVEIISDAYIRIEEQEQMFEGLEKSKETAVALLEDEKSVKLKLTEEMESLKLEIHELNLQLSAQSAS